MRSSNAVDKVIEACIDDARMLEHESETVGKRRSQVLHHLASKRAQFVHKLRHVAGRSETGSRNGSWTELGRELGRSFRLVLGGPSDGDAITACRKSCRRTESRFDAALRLPLPPAVHAVLVEQRAQLDQDMNALADLQY
jgi:hypothetical protein